MKRPSRAGLAAVVALALGLAACSSGASGTPTPSPTPTSTPTPAASSGSSAVAFPSIGNSDKELEALIPDSIGGVTLQKSSMRGNEFMSSANADPESVAFLNALGVQPSDIGVAFGFGFSAEAQSALGVFVFKANGVPAARLLSVFKDAADKNTDTPVTWTSATVAGKSVDVGTSSQQGAPKTYLYATNEILFFVVATTDAQASDALSKLP